MAVQTRLLADAYRKARNAQAASFRLPGQGCVQGQLCIYKMNQVVTLQNAVSLGGSLKKSSHRRQASIPSSPKVLQALTGLHTRHASLADAPVDISFRYPAARSLKSEHIATPVTTWVAPLSSASLKFHALYRFQAVADVL